MTKKVKVLVAADGTIAWVYDDALLPLISSGGSVSVERFADVEYDVSLKRWEARRKGSGALVDTAVTRVDCVRREHEHAQKHLEQQMAAIGSL